MNRKAMFVPIIALSFLLTGCVSPRTEQLVAQCAEAQFAVDKSTFLKVARDRLEFIDSHDSWLGKAILRVRDPGVWTHVSALRECVSNSTG